MEQSATLLINRKFANPWSLAFFFALYSLVIAGNVLLVIYTAMNYTPDYSFYFLILSAAIVIGICIYFFVDSFLYIKKFRINNSQQRECIAYDPIQQCLIVHSLSAVYKIPLRNIRKLVGDYFFSHSFLSIDYVNKNNKKQSIEVGMVSDIFKVKRQLRSLLGPRKK